MSAEEVLESRAANEQNPGVHKLVRKIVQGEIDGDLPSSQNTTLEGELFGPKFVTEVPGDGSGNMTDTSWQTESNEDI